MLQRVPCLHDGERACCGRCGALLVQQPADPFTRPLALTVAAATALVIANCTPLLLLSAAGRESSTTLAGGAYRMWEQGSEVTALVVGFCAVAAPIGYVGLLLAVLLMVRRGSAPHWVATPLRVADRLRPWSMNDVLLLGLLVALTKIAQLATVIAGPALYAVAALVLLLPAIVSCFDARAVWRRIDWATARPN
ncbi:MAG: paraquat-inducible protein A [Burkholderiales bacterium]|nr:paraquat-inducible protein A [Burkholderiales bacterium]